MMGGFGREGAPGAGAGAGQRRERSALYLCRVGMLLRTRGVTGQFLNSVLSGSFPSPWFWSGVVVSYSSVKGHFELWVQLNPK